LLTQDGTQALHVARDYRQRDVPLEPHYPVIRADVQAMLFERIDGGLDSRMLSAQSNEFFARFSLAIYCAESAFLGQNNKPDNLFEILLIVLRMESLVHANAANCPKALLGFFNDGYRYDIVGGLPPSLDGAG
jgi:hypothetical protein